MERYVDMESPITGGKVKEISTTEIKEFRREEYRVNVRYYICEDSSKLFSTIFTDMI